MVVPKDTVADVEAETRIEPTGRLSRRRMLGGAGAAVAAVLVARATPAEAASGQALIAGADNTATTSTTLAEVGPGPALGLTGNNGPTLSVQLAPSPSSLPLTIGLAGAGDSQALSAHPVTGTAVLGGFAGTGDVAIGVLGSSGPTGSLNLHTMGAGVAGRAAPRGAAATVGVLGLTPSTQTPNSLTMTAAVAGLGGTKGAGVLGASGQLPTVVDKLGPMGVVGLLGTAAIPGTVSMTTAVAGLSGGASAGVIGGSLSGVGVRGVSYGAQSAVQAVGTRLAALDVRGVARFNRSGAIAIKGTASTGVVTVPGGVTAATLAFATLQTNMSDVYVRAVVPHPTNSTLTIVLNKAPGRVTGVNRTVRVAWFVVG